MIVQRFQVQRNKNRTKLRNTCQEDQVNTTKMQNYWKSQKTLTSFKMELDSLYLANNIHCWKEPNQAFLREDTY